jgi:hypothetical protein
MASIVWQSGSNGMWCMKIEYSSSTKTWILPLHVDTRPIESDGQSDDDHRLGWVRQMEWDARRTNSSCVDTLCNDVFNLDSKQSLFRARVRETRSKWILSWKLRGQGWEDDREIQSLYKQHMVSTVVAQWFNLLLIINKVLGSIPVSNSFESD